MSRPPVTSGPPWSAARVALLVFAVAATTACGQSGDAARPAARHAAGGSDAAPPVAVATALAAARDVPLQLTGLARLTPTRNAAIRPQVDGVLTAVPLVEGAWVARGTVLATIDPRPYEAALASAEAALARDRAVAAHAQQIAARTAKLRAENLVATQDLDDAQASAREADAAVHVDLAQVASAQLQLGYTRLVAPFDGRLGTRRIDAGNLVRAGDANALVTLAQVDPIAALVSLPVSALAPLGAALARGPVPAIAYATGSDRPLATGQVVALDNAVDAATATLQVKVAFPNPDGHLWPNQMVRVALTHQTLVGATVIPAAAVQRGPDGAFAFVVDAGHRARRRALALTATTDLEVAVAEGIAPGDAVVVDGAHLLRDGSAVAAAEGTGRGAAAP